MNNNLFYAIFPCANVVIISEIFTLEFLQVLILLAFQTLFIMGVRKFFVSIGKKRRKKRNKKNKNILL